MVNIDGVKTPSNVLNFFFSVIILSLFQGRIEKDDVNIANLFNVFIFL